MSSTSEEGYMLNKSGHFALLGKVHNDEIFKESDLNLRISTLNEKERARRIREAIKQKQLEEKKRDNVIGSGSNNWIFATDEYGKYLVPEVVKAGGKKPKFAVSGKQNRYTDQSLIVYSILTLLEKQPQLYGRGIQTFIPNQIDDKNQTDVLSWVKSKNRRNTAYEKEYDIDDDVFGDLVVSNLILPRGDNKLANYLTQNEKLLNEKIKITKIARCDLDALNFFVGQFNKRNLRVFDDTDWLYTWSAMGLSKDQLLKIKKKLIDKIKNISPEDVVLAVQKQFSICGVKCDERTVRKALFYYKSLLSNLRGCNTGQYTRNFYLRHTRLSNMTDEDIKKAIVEEAIKENKEIVKLSQELQTFDNIKGIPIQAHDKTTYNDMFEHFKKVRDIHKAVIDDDVKQAITKKLEEFKCFSFEEIAKSKIHLEPLESKKEKKNKNKPSVIINNQITKEPRRIVVPTNKKKHHVKIEITEEQKESTHKVKEKKKMTQTEKQTDLNSLRRKKDRRKGKEGCVSCQNDCIII